MTSITSDYTDDQLNAVMKSAKRNGLTLAQHQHNLCLYCSAIDNNAHPDPVPQPSEPRPTGGIPAGKLTFSDEFDGDLSKWNRYDNDPGFNDIENQRFWADAVSIVGGKCRIRATVDATGKVRSGAISTRSLGGKPHTFAQAGGVWEARMACSPLVALPWPAFWLVSPSDVAGVPGWPAYGEIDIMEAYANEPSTPESNFHDPGGQIGGKPHKVSGTVADFHTYAVSWTTAGIDWWYDGVKVRSFVPTTAAQRVALTYVHSIILNLSITGYMAAQANNLPINLDVDYVRVWAPA